MQNKFFTFVIALIILFVSTSCALDFPSTIVSAEVNYQSGDIDCDGKVSPYDYILCKRHCMDIYVLTDSQFNLADMNRDSTVDQYDYVLIRRYLLGTYVQDDSQIEYVPNVVSGGKQYTVSVSAASKYEDSYNCELTDGVFNESNGYWNDTFAGFNSNVNIIVDLEEDGKDINKFELSYLSTNEAGINIPKSIKVYGSDDKSKWTSLGNMTIPEFENGKVMRASLNVKETNYRYVLFEVQKKASWVFIDEVYVYSSVPKLKEDDALSCDEVYKLSAVSDNVFSANRNLVKTGKSFDKLLGSSAISVNCEYTVDCSEYDWRSGESSTMLTDGSITGAAFELKEWVGVSLKTSPAITIDLGEIREDVYGFELHCFIRPLAGVNLPSYCDIYVSDNGNDFTHIARNFSIDNEQENFCFRVAFDKLLKARYVRFSLPAGNGYCWIEEAAVYGNCTRGVEYDSLYGSLDMDFTAPEEYWKQGSDYNTTQNLLRGLSQQITTGTYLDKATYSKHNSPEDCELLTDGIMTTDTYCYNGKWFHFNHGVQRSIFYDLGAISSVSEFSVRILDYGDWAIYLPEYVRVVLSENGSDWYLASDVVPVSNKGNIVNVSAKFNKNYRARYVMFCFDLQGHVFIDEITLKGKKNIVGASSLSALTPYPITEAETEEIGYAAPSDKLLGGVRDIALIYHNTTVMDEEFFLPYVAYLDENKNILDTMFDGYLFLPSTGALPSGGRPYGTNTASDWNYLFDEIFTEGKNFDALNKTCETVKKALGLAENKLKVYVTIPHMDDTLEDFGDIDFDGKNDSLTSLKNRVYIARYYAQRVISEFNSRNYENLELCGFYWFHEEISGGDVQTAIEVNKMFDEIGYQLFWIPYFNAAGYSRWAEFGFDVGCLQPNYAFSLDVRESRIESATQLAKRFGMCIEMEIHDSAIYDARFFQKYMGYLSGGVKFGYMTDAIHMYYQSAEIFGNASRAVGTTGRLIYDYTYQFIKGTLDPTPEKLPDKHIKAKKNNVYTNTFNYDFDINNKYRISKSPEHGSVTILENGKYIYCPHKDFTGTDTFTFQYSNHLDWSEDITVTVTVE